jgi:hypothetical protein
MLPSTYSSGRLRRSLGRATHQEVTTPFSAGSCRCADSDLALSQNHGGTNQGEQFCEFLTGPRSHAVEKAALARAWRQPTIRVSAYRPRAVHVRICLGPFRSSPLLTGRRIRRDPHLRGPLPAVPDRPNERPAAIPDCPQAPATTMKITRKTAHSLWRSGRDGVIRSNCINQGLLKRRVFRHEHQ